MDAKLTSKQESFCQLVATGKTQIEAYRQAYPASAAMRKTQDECASVLMRNPKIAARIHDLREPALMRVRDQCQISVESLTMDLLEAREQAMMQQQPAAAVAATMAIARLHGLLVADRRNDRIPLSDFSALELREMLQSLKSFREKREIDEMINTRQPQPTQEHVRDI